MTFRLALFRDKFSEYGYTITGRARHRFEAYVMLRVQTKRSSISDEINIGTKNADQITARCVYHSSDDEEISISGFELSDSQLSRTDTLIETEFLYVVHVKIETSTWKEFHRWIGWEDNLQLILLWKEITDSHLRTTVFGELVNHNPRLIVSKDHRKSISFSIDLLECCTIDSVRDALSPFDLHDLLQHRLRGSRS